MRVKQYLLNGGRLDLTQFYCVIYYAIYTDIYYVIYTDVVSMQPRNRLCCRGSIFLTNLQESIVKFDLLAEQENLEELLQGE